MSPATSWPVSEPFAREAHADLGDNEHCALRHFEVVRQAGVPVAVELRATLEKRPWCGVADRNPNRVIGPEKLRGGQRVP